MNFIDMLLHINYYIPAIMDQVGGLIYLLLFLILFCETGLVITPFLPGDSIIFTCGALAASGAMNLPLLLVLFTVAAILGDAVNYLIGKKIGKKLLEKDHKLIKKKHVRKAEEFYDKYGGKAIFLSRFVPIVRTFAPFVAGIGEMRYRKFAMYNIVGGIVWVLFFSFLGYFFGNIPVVEEHFSLVVIGIVFISIIPLIVEVIRSIRSKKKGKGKAN